MAHVANTSICLSCEQYFVDMRIDNGTVGSHCLVSVFSEITSSESQEKPLVQVALKVGCM